jgi:hypothetical protein
MSGIGLKADTEATLWILTLVSCLNPTARQEGIAWRKEYPLLIERW